MPLPAIDKSWTLFLDRDGVLNFEKQNDYIRNVDEFNLYPDVAAAVGKVTPLFQHIIIVTNQKGVGRGLMTENDLNQIHTKMLSEFAAHQGVVTDIFYCTDTQNDSPNRKPNAGMAYQAKLKYPSIDFSKSIMVGNKLSDMQFGKQVGMYTVFVATTNPEISFPHEWIDDRYDSFPDFVQALINP